MAGDCNENYKRFIALFADPGRDSLLCAFNFYVPDNQLQSFFHSVNTKVRLAELEQLDMLTVEQYEMLTSDHVSTERFDIGLLFLLLRFVVESVGQPRNVWEKKPLLEDTSIPADLCRLRQWRNDVLFRPTESLEDTFDDLWGEVRLLLLRIVQNSGQDNTYLKRKITNTRSKLFPDSDASYKQYSTSVFAWCKADLKRFESVLQRANQQSLVSG